MNAAVPILAASAAALAAAAQAAWTPQTSGVSARLRGVSAVSQSVAWASGANGTVIRTTDGGREWKTVTVPDAPRLDFRDVDAFSETTAYILSIGKGEASRIYKTVDGGDSWTLQLANTDPAVFLDAMAFWSAERGIAFSDSVDGRFVVFRTTDGRVWQRLPAEALPPARSNEGAFAASGTNVAVHGSNHVWIGTTAGRVLRSTDGGRSWMVASTPMATGESTGIFSVAFRDGQHGVAVGGDYRRETEALDNAAFTTDGGRSWTLATGLAGFRSVVAHLPGSKSTWIAVGPQGSDRSDDDGRTWTPITREGFHAFSFAPRSRTGWAVGERGTIGRLEGF